MENKSLSCCFTGYRPQKFPFPISRTCAEYIEFENRLITKIAALAKNGCDTFITGMAMGFDIIAAECVLSVKNQLNMPQIRLICAVPFKGQKDSFPILWQRKYENIIRRCDDIVVLSDEFSRASYMKRNIYMVDNSDIVMAFFDGKSGGTKNTVDYAERKKRTVIYFM